MQRLFLVRKGYALIFRTDGASAELVRAPPSAEADALFTRDKRCCTQKAPGGALRGQGVRLWWVLKVKRFSACGLPGFENLQAGNAFCGSKFTAAFGFHQTSFDSPLCCLAVSRSDTSVKAGCFSGSGLSAAFHSSRASSPRLAGWLHLRAGSL